MPLAIVTFDASDYGGMDFDPRRAKVYATNSAEDGVIWDTVANHQYIGSGTGTIYTDGTGTISVPIPAAGFIPSTWQTTIHFDVPDRNAPGGRRRASAGPFTITASGPLGSLVEEMPMLPVYAGAVLDLVQGYLDHGSVSGAVTIDPAIGTHVLDATGATVLTLGTAVNGSIVTVLVNSGAASVTINGLVDAELTDAAFATFVRIRGAWVLASAGAGTPAVPDTTPPTDVTGLTATGGDGQVSATWTVATDAESSVKYRARVYITGTTAPAWPTSGPLYGLTSPSLLVTGLAAGDYTVQVHAYSAGGASTTATSASVTVTAALTTLLLDTFTRGPGAMVTAYPTPDVGPDWTAPGGASASGQIVSGKFQPNSTVAVSPTPSLASSLTMDVVQDGTSGYVEFGCGGPYSGFTTAKCKANGQVEINGAGGTAIYNASGGTNVYTPTGYITPSTYSVKLTHVGGVATLYVDDVKIIEAPSAGTPANEVFVGAQAGYTTAVDNIEAKG